MTGGKHLGLGGCVGLDSGSAIEENSEMASVRNNAANDERLCDGARAFCAR